MSLPVLHHQSQPRREDLIRLFHRTEMQWAGHLGEVVEMDFGTAVSNLDLPDLPLANSIQDAFLPEGLSVEDVVERVDLHFTQRKTKCQRWTLNPSVPPAQTRPLEKYFQENEFQADTSDIYYLQQMPQRLVNEPAGLKIIPARASYRHVQTLAEQANAHQQEWMMHLDDPHWDALLAMRDGEAVGYAGVLTVGDIGRIDSLFVTEKMRRQSIGRTMLGRALETCLRSQFKHVFVAAGIGNDVFARMAGQTGFMKIGQMIAYRNNPS